MQMYPKFVTSAQGLFLNEPASTRQNTVGSIYNQYPLLLRVKNVLNTVQNNNVSTGKEIGRAHV